MVRDGTWFCCGLEVGAEGDTVVRMTREFTSWFKRDILYKPQGQRTAPNEPPQQGPRKAQGQVLLADQEVLECEVSRDSAIWRAQAFDAYANVRDELNRVAQKLPYTQTRSSSLLSQIFSASSNPSRSPHPVTTEGYRSRVIANASAALREALTAMAPRVRPKWWRPQWWLRLKLFYSGSPIEQTWLAIHRARAELFLLYPDDELKAQTEALGVLLTDLPETSTPRVR